MVIKVWKSVAVLMVMALALCLGIVAVPMAGTVEANPGVLYVDDDADEKWYEDPTHFKVIQDAINATEGDSTIKVYPGTYKECLVIDKKKSLTLQSEPEGEAIIDVEGQGCDAIQVGAKEEANRIVIDGFTICNAAGEESGIRASNGSELVIRNNLIRDCGAGIVLNGLRDVLVESNHFEGNHKGIIWMSGSDIKIRNNTFIHYDIGIHINMFMESLDGFQVTGNDLVGCDHNQGILWTIVKGGSDGGETPIVQYNNIYGNLEYGACTTVGGGVDATHNWWGHPSGPYHSPPLPCNPYGQGDAVSDGVTFKPWLLSLWETTDTVHTKTDLLSEENKSVDIPGVVEAIAETGEGIVTVGQYFENPGTGTFSGEAGSYVDVHITQGNTIEELLIKLFYNEGDLAEGVSESSLGMYWWDDLDWELCSDTGVNTADDFIWARITGDTEPSLGDLTGTPFGGHGYPPEEAGGKAHPAEGVGGKVYPVSKANILAPWIALSVTIIVGSIIVVRRRAQS